MLDPLALAARELVRVASPSSGPKPTTSSSSRTAPSARGEPIWWTLSGSPSVADRHARVERRVGILEDDLDPAPHGSSRFASGAPVPNTTARSRLEQPTMQRPSVDFPQPDSPTRPSASPGDVEVDAVDRLQNVADRAADPRPRSGKCLRGP